MNKSADTSMQHGCRAGRHDSWGKLGRASLWGSVFRKERRSWAEGAGRGIELEGE